MQMYEWTRMFRCNPRGDPGFARMMRALIAIGSGLNLVRVSSSTGVEAQPKDWAGITTGAGVWART